MNLSKVLFISVGCLACISLSVRIVWPPPVTFSGHTTRVVAVVISPDGKTLASTSEDRTIKLWNVATRKELGSFQGTNATFNADGSTLAWIDGPTIRLRNMATGEAGMTLRGHSDCVRSVAFSADGKTLVSASSDSTVKLWNVTTAEERATYPANTSEVDLVLLGPDGKALALTTIGTLNATMKFWDATTGVERSATPLSEWSFECLAFSPDGKLLASGCEPVRLWDVATGKNIASLDTLSEGVEEIRFSPDGKTLAAVSRGLPEICFWDVASGKRTATWKSMCHRPRPRLFRYVWDALPRVFEEHDFIPLSVWFRPDGGIVALGFDNRDNTTVEMRQVTGVAFRKK